MKRASFGCNNLHSKLNYQSLFMPVCIRSDGLSRVQAVGTLIDNFMHTDMW